MAAVAEYFCRKPNGTVIGPFTAKALVDLARRRMIKPDDLIRSGQSQKWHRAEKVRGLFVHVPPNAPGEVIFGETFPSAAHGGTHTPSIGVVGAVSGSKRRHSSILLLGDLGRGLLVLVAAVVERVWVMLCIAVFALIVIGGLVVVFGALEDADQRIEDVQRGATKLSESTEKLRTDLEEWSVEQERKERERQRGW
jgi:hypothetical protein